MNTISFVIPCFRSEHTIHAVVEEIYEEMKGKGRKFDIIIVNDCSPDQVWMEIKQLTAKYSNIKGVSLARNFGQHAALMAGYRFADGDLVFSLDDDGQAPVDQIFDLINKIEEGYDVVYGRYPVIKQNGFRRFGTWVNAKMSELLLGKPKEIDITSFYVMRKFVRDEIIKYDNSYPYLLGLVLRVTRNIANVDVIQRERKEGKSGYRLSALVKLWMNGFTAFSVAPLRFATLFGIVTGVAGFGVAVYVVIKKLLNPLIVVGWSSMFSALLIIGGCIMFMLGMIGEYIGRIYISINNAPQYVINEVVGRDNSFDKEG